MPKKKLTYYMKKKLEKENAHKMKGGEEEVANKINDKSSEAPNLSKEEINSLIQRNNQLESQNYLNNLADDKMFRATLLNYLKEVITELSSLKETIVKVSSEEELPKKELPKMLEQRKPEMKKPLKQEEDEDELSEDDYRSEEEEEEEDEEYAPRTPVIRPSISGRPPLRR